MKELSQLMIFQKQSP